MTTAVAAETRPRHRMARVTADPAAALTSLSHEIRDTYPITLASGSRVIVTLGCFTNGTIAQVVTNSLSPLSGQHLYDGSRATV